MTEQENGDMAATYDGKVYKPRPLNDREKKKVFDDYRHHCKMCKNGKKLSCVEYTHIFRCEAPQCKGTNSGYLGCNKTEHKGGSVWNLFVHCKFKNLDVLEYIKSTRRSYAEKTDQASKEAMARLHVYEKFYNENGGDVDNMPPLRWVLDEEDSTTDEETKPDPGKPTPVKPNPAEVKRQQRQHKRDMKAKRFGNFIPQTIKKPPT